MGSISFGKSVMGSFLERQLNARGREVERSFERLSSGLRINRAADDAAGLHLSSTLKADARLHGQALRNISDGLSVLSIAESALRELNTISERQLELASQAANGVLSLSQRRALHTEANSLVEEFNRIVADELRDHYFITEQSGLDNLRRESRREEALHFVGNTMIDTLVAFEPQVQASDVLQRLDLGMGGHVLMTIHRPATVDVPERLAELLDLIAEVTTKRKVVFPIHPRTVKNIEAFGLKAKCDAIKGLVLTEPLDYFAFQKLIATCAFILTDSGGIQEESTFRQVPCLTLRPNTERPVTITLGSNELVPLEMDAVHAAITRIEQGTFKKGKIPPLWDGHATERIIEVLERVL